MNQKPLLIAIATLIVAIFAFAQVYIIFTVTTINDRINSVDQRLTHLETRFDERFTELETHFDKRFNLIMDHLNRHNVCGRSESPDKSLDKGL